MKPQLSFFRPQSADELTLEALIKTSVEDPLCNVELRYFNVISDLNFIKPWLRDPDKRTNWQNPEDLTPILRYEKIRKGSDARSFMVLLDGKQQVQLDLRLPRSVYWLLSSRSNVQVVSIEYLYRQNHRSPVTFKPSLEILCRYFFSYPGDSVLQMTIPSGDRDTIDQALAARFVERPMIQKAGPHVQSFCMTKQEYENAMND